MTTHSKIRIFIAFLLFIFGSFALVPVIHANQYFYSKHIPIASVYEEQYLDWSCGVHSAHRILRTYGLDVDYQEMKNNIGPYDPDLSLSCSGNFIEILFCEILRAAIGDIGGVLPNFGQPTGELVAKLNEYKSGATYSIHANLEKIKSLIDEDIPAMALLQIGTETIQNDAGNIKVPLLHWVVLSGYFSFLGNINSIYYYETTSGQDSKTTCLNCDYSLNDDREMVWSNVVSRSFHTFWNWEYDGYDKSAPIHDMLVDDIGLDIRTLIWFQPTPKIETANGPILTGSEVVEMCSISDIKGDASITSTLSVSGSNIQAVHQTNNMMLDTSDFNSGIYTATCSYTLNGHVYNNMNVSETFEFRVGDLSYLIPILSLILN